MKPALKNGTSWEVALTRAVIGAAVAGAGAVVAIMGTVEPIELARAGLGAAIAVLSVRFAAEGWMDKPEP